MNLPHDVVDVDEPSTWPEAVLRRAEAWSASLTGSTKATGDLDLTPEDETRLLLDLDGRRMLVYHATRLLPHEVAGIRATGLSLASQDLVRRRVSEAFEAGTIDRHLRDILWESHVFNDSDRGDNRIGRISLVLSRKPFDQRPNGFHYLLSEWGGELITMSVKGSELRKELQRLGRPAIVVAAVNLRDGPAKHWVFPGLPQLLVGRLLDLDDLGGVISYRSRVPRSGILAIWQPGDPGYDRHAALPRA